MDDPDRPVPAMAMATMMEIGARMIEIQHELDLIPRSANAWRVYQARALVNKLSRQLTMLAYRLEKGYSEP